MKTEELENEISNLKHDYEIVSAERNSLRDLAKECKLWIQGHMDSTGFTARRTAEIIINRINQIP